MHHVNNAYLSTPLQIHDNQGKQRRDATGSWRKVDSAVASTFFFFLLLRGFKGSLCRVYLPECL